MRCGPQGPNPQLPPQLSAASSCHNATAFRPGTAATAGDPRPRRPPVIQLQRCAGGGVCVGGQVDAAADAQALVTGAQLLSQAADGLMPWRGRPDALKRGLIARVPPLDFTEPKE